MLYNLEILNYRNKCPIMKSPHSAKHISLCWGAVRAQHLLQILKTSLQPPRLYLPFLFFRAALEENPYFRLKKVVKWYLSGFYKKPKVMFIFCFFFLPLREFPCIYCVGIQVPWCTRGVSAFDSMWVLQIKQVSRIGGKYLSLLRRLTDPLWGC